MINRTRKYKVNNSSDELNSGELLKVYFEAHRTRKSALARKLNRHKSTVLAFQKNSTIQTAVLWEICYALEHNFFEDIASKLPTTFTTNAPVKLDLEEKIIALETELAQTRTERDILLKAIGK